MAPRTLRTCALISGGLDSAFLLQSLLAQRVRVIPVYVCCGFRWETAERYWLGRLLRAMRHPRLASLVTIHLPMRSLYGRHWSFGDGPVPSATSPDAAVYLPGRNAFLLTAAARVADTHHADAIALGLLKGNPFGDASPRFLRLAGQALSEALRHPVRVKAPLARRRKVDLIHRLSPAAAALSFSCLNPRGRSHCSRCNKCAERRRAYRAARVPDPTRYAR